MRFATRPVAASGCGCYWTITAHGIDRTLAALDAHPNIEIQLFNPSSIRTPRALNYLFDFFRLNRRMHNKSFTADNQVTIIGGRNIGDEYFGATDGLLYVDLDVMAGDPWSRICRRILTAIGRADRLIQSLACCRPLIPQKSRSSHRLHH
jgi:putative cardiolipin synthase